MPAKGSDEDRPVDVPLRDDDEWEEAGCRDLVADKAGAAAILLVMVLLTWTLITVA